MNDETEAAITVSAKYSFIEWCTEQILSLALLISSIIVCLHKPGSKVAKVSTFSFITARKRSYGKAMFSLVCLSVHRGGVAMWPLPLMHYTSPYRTSQPPGDQTWDPLQPCPPLLVTSCGNHWRPVQTCSLKSPPPTSTDIRWSPKPLRLACGWHASYWNAFLFINTNELYQNLIS